MQDQKRLSQFLCWTMWCVFGLGSMAGGCGGSATGPASTLQITVEGRLERGNIVELEVTRSGSPVEPSTISWSVRPEGAVSFLSDGRADLLRAGELRLEATVGDERGIRSVEVDVPPSVFFDMVRDGNRDIYRVALDGRDLVRLTYAPAPDLDPAVAGGRVVFSSLRDGNQELYSMTIAGGDLVRITNATAQDKDPAFTSNGGMLAFVRNSSGVFRVWTATGDGSGAQPATGEFGGSGAIERSPNWAPAGDRFVFMSTANGTADLFTWSPEGIAPAVTDPGVDVEPAWGPDGDRLAFAADRGNGADIWLHELETGSETRLTNRPENEGQPAWVPDGRVLYTVFSEQRTALWWIDPAKGSSPVRLYVAGESPEHPTAELEATQ